MIDLGGSGSKSEIVHPATVHPAARKCGSDPLPQFQRISLPSAAAAATRVLIPLHLIQLNLNYDKYLFILFN